MFLSPAHHATRVQGFSRRDEASTSFRLYNTVSNASRSRHLCVPVSTSRVALRSDALFLFALPQMVWCQMVPRSVGRNYRHLLFEVNLE